MVLLLFYLSALSLQNALAQNEECKGELKTSFDEETLAKNLYIPREFAVDKTLNILYFTHESDDLAKIDINTGKLTNLEGVKSRSQAVNQENHDVYLATKTGIYRYNDRDTSTVFQYLGASDKAVNIIFYYNDTIFFTESSSKQLYMLKDGVVMDGGWILKQTQDDHAVVDGEGTLFFTYDGLLYSLNNGADFVVYDKSNGLIIRELGTDNYGGVLVCTEYGVFFVSKKTLSLGKALADKTQGCMSVATDRDNNLMYSDGNNVRRLKVGLRCFTYMDI